jgi:hypothetical protein
MSTPRVTAVEQKLAETLAKLKESKDPDIRRTLLTEMRILLAELDRLVYSAPSVPPTPK